MFAVCAAELMCISVGGRACCMDACVAISRCAW